MKFLYIGDNSDSLNWGCRATSLALRQLIGRRGGIVGSVPTGLIARNWGYSDRMGDAGYERLTRVLDRGKVRRIPVAGAIATGIVGALGVASAIGHDIDANVKVLERARDHHPGMRTLFDKIDACDAAVVNGEGDLIFSTPARQRLLFILTVCRLVLKRGKKLFYLNAMASAAPDTPANSETIAAARAVLAEADVFSLRDPVSFAFAREHRLASSDRMVLHADAVFSWAPMFARGVERYEQAALLPFFERTGHAMPAVLQEPYLLVGGSSRSANRPREAVAAYVELVESLKRLGLPIALAPGCTGDLFLKDVAKATGATMLPIDAPILANAAILANARLYVSGRWHPSIMASLGGTPCVFMGSNSHKTLAIQQMLGTTKPHEFSPWPKAAEIADMTAQADAALMGAQARRVEIATRAAALGQEAEAVVDHIAPRALRSAA